MKRRRGFFGRRKVTLDVDASRFGAPLALRTKWKPAKGGGANFRTGKLREVGPSRLEFRATVGAILFYAAVLGIAVTGVSVTSASLFGVAELGFASFLPPVVCLLFVGAGAFLFWHGTRPVVFDQSSGYFWTERKGPDQVFNPDKLKGIAQLFEVHALQIQPELCKTKNSNYYSFELNLVLKDGERRNVMDHGNLRGLLADANTLSAFLQVPIWDASFSIPDDEREFLS